MILGATEHVVQVEEHVVEPDEAQRAKQHIRRQPARPCGGRADMSLPFPGLAHSVRWGLPRSRVSRLGHPTPTPTRSRVSQESPKVPCAGESARRLANGFCTASDAASTTTSHWKVPANHSAALAVVDTAEEAEAKRNDDGNQRVDQL